MKQQRGTRGTAQAGQLRTALRHIEDTKPSLAGGGKKEKGYTMKPFYRRRSQGPARRSQQLTARATLCRFYIGYSSLPSLICLPRGKPIPGCGWVELNTEGGAVGGQTRLAQGYE